MQIQLHFGAVKDCAGSTWTCVCSRRCNYSKSHTFRVDTRVRHYNRLHVMSSNYRTGGNDRAIRAPSSNHALTTTGAPAPSSGSRPSLLARIKYLAMPIDLAAMFGLGQGWHQASLQEWKHQIHVASAPQNMCVIGLCQNFNTSFFCGVDENTRKLRTDVMEY